MKRGPMPRNGYESLLAAESTQSMLERQNNQQVDELRAKVNSLKSVSIDIHDELKNHNEMLDVLGNDADETFAFMGVSTKRLGKLMQSGNGRVMCYLIGFVVTTFIVIWFLIR